MREKEEREQRDDELPLIHRQRHRLHMHGMCCEQQRGDQPAAHAEQATAECEDTERDGRVQHITGHAEEHRRAVADHVLDGHDERGDRSIQLGIERRRPIWSRQDLPDVVEIMHACILLHEQHIIEGELVRETGHGGQERHNRNRDLLTPAAWGIAAGILAHGRTK